MLLKSILLISIIVLPTFLSLYNPIIDDIDKLSCIKALFILPLIFVKFGVPSYVLFEFKKVNI
jgi:hypothetical protein